MSPPLTRDDLKRVAQDADRLAALNAAALLDTPADEAFDRFTRLAVRLLKADAAFVSLLDSNRVFFKSYARAGGIHPEIREVPIEESFCPYTVAQGKLLLVSDARNDPQFQTHSAIRDFGVVAYAGMPLVMADGCALGSFCVIDSHPRAWTHDEIDLLTDLSAAVVSEIELRVGIARHMQDAALLKASEHRFNTAFQNNPLPISIVSYPDGRVLDVNQAVVRQLGYHHNDIVGKTTAELQIYTEPAEREAFFRMLREQGRVTDFEAKLKTKDGEVRTYLMSSEVIELEGRPCLLTSTNDITARKRTEIALHQALERLELAQSAGRSGTFDWNVTTNEVQWSEAEEKLYGLEPGGFKGKYENWRKTVHPDDIENAEKALLKAINNALEMNTEFRIFRPDGTVRWIYATGNVIYDPLGKPLRMVGINIDITERKCVEIALREADRRKDEFLAMLAHELRNPLAPIRNAVEILKTSGADEAHFKNARDIVERQVKHMTRLIDDLVDVARLTQGKITLKKENIELSAVIGDALDLARPIIAEHGHHLTIDLPREAARLNGDGVRLSQALGNVLTNAAKYTQPVGKIELMGSYSAAEINIVVRDNGIGIAPDMLPHVFDLFTQSERTLDRAQGGLGIGLALVKRLIELHGGQVAARSAGIGQGSEFVLRLPRAHDVGERFELTKAAVIAAAEKSSRRILVVDDNEDSAEVTAILLRLEGHEVAVAHTGIAAIEQIPTVLPDILLLDIGLPEMDGYELARHLRNLPETRDAVFIAITGYGRPDDRQNSKNAGYDHHLVKPIEPEELLALIATLG
jgi:PAS domain S-box-containing protein